MVNYFFDSYAIIEIIEDNESYRKYAEFPLVTTELNKIEILWWAINKHGIELGRMLAESISKTADIDNETLLEAMEFRKKHKKRSISYTDSIGYIFSQKNKMLFLTGDDQFKDMPGVEFVK